MLPGYQERYRVTGISMHVRSVYGMYVHVGQYLSQSVVVSHVGATVHIDVVCSQVPGGDAL